MKCESQKQKYVSGFVTLYVTSFVNLYVVTEYSTPEKSKVNELRKTVQVHMNDLYSKYKFHVHFKSIV